MARKLMINGTATVSNTDYTLQDMVTSLETQQSLGAQFVRDYNTSTQSISASRALVTNMTITMETHGGDLYVTCSLPFYNSGGTGNVRLYMDGVDKDYLFQSSNKTSGVQITGQRILKNVPAGTHTFVLSMAPQNTGGSYTCYIGTYCEKTFAVIELNYNNLTSGLVYVPTNSTIQSLISVLNTTPGSLYNFSASEQAVGTWIDGKTIYRKVLTGQCAQNTTTSISTGVNNIDKLMWCDGFCFANNGTWAPLPRVNSSSFGYQIALGSASGYTSINVAVGSSFSAAVTVYMIIYYTKS